MKKLSQLSAGSAQSAEPTRNLRAPGPERDPEMLAQVLKEQEQLWNQGRRALVEVFLATAPTLKNPLDARELILHEIKLRRLQGENPTRDQYLQRFPEYKDALTESQFSRDPKKVGLSGDTFSPENRPARRVIMPSVSNHLWPDIEGYQILDELGQGGMGVVYKACQLSLKRIVAIKMIRPQLGFCNEVLRRFQKEAESIARIKHPHIVEIYSLGTLNEGSDPIPSPYFVLEFLEGGDLFTHWNRGPQPERPSAMMIQKLASAIHCAHQEGILHRDLKPANVLLSTDGEPRITDFGLVKSLNQSRNRTDVNAPTREGLVVGTPEYMAPEQAVGQRKLTPAVDVYALGVMLYEAVTGRCPFEGASELETLDLIRDQEPLPPRQLRPELSRDLETICLKCLDKDPEKRYPSAEALSTDLQRFLEGLPIEARPVSQFEKAWRALRRNPTVSMLLSTLAFVILAGVILVSWKWKDAERRAQSELRARQKATRLSHRLQEASEEAHLRSAGASLHLGTGRAQQGYTKRGLNWMLQGLSSAIKAKNKSLERAARLNLAAWESRLLPCASVAHAGWVLDVALSPDGKRVATAGRDRQVKIWDRATGRHLCANLQHTFPVFAVCFTPDGRYLITGSGGLKGREGELRLWDPRTGKQIGTTIVQPRTILRVKVNASGDRILTLQSRGQILKMCHFGESHLWKLENQQLSDAKSLERSTTCMSFARKGEIVLTGRDDGTLTQWSARTGEQRSESHPAPGNSQSRGARNTLWSMIVGQDGESVLTTHLTQEQGRIQFDARFWNWSTGKMSTPSMRIPGFPRSISLSGDGQFFAVGLTSFPSPKSKKLQGAALIYRTTSGQPIRVMPHQRPVWSVALSSDARLLATGCEDSRLRLFDVASGDAIGKPIKHRGTIRKVVMSLDASVVATASATASADSIVCRLPRANGRAVLAPHSETGELLSISADGRWTAFALDGEILIQDLLKRKQRFIRPANRARTVAWTQMGETPVLLTGSNRGELSLWDLTTGKLLRQMKQRKPINALTVSASGETAVTAVARSSSIQIWNLKTGETEVIQFENDPGKISHLAMSRDGRLIAAATPRGKVHLLREGQVICVLSHPSLVKTMTFSHEGRFLLTGTVNGFAQLWETKTGATVGDAFLHRSEVTALCLSADDRWIAIGHKDGRVHLYDRATGYRIGPAFTHRASIQALTFLSDWRLLTGTIEQELGSWKLPSPKEGTEKELRRWLEKHSEVAPAVEPEL